MLGVSCAGFYAWRSRLPSARSVRHAWLTDVIREIHAASYQSYGANRVYAELVLGRGSRVGHDAVAMLMNRAGLAGRDKEPDRLRLAESIGADPVDISKGDPVEQITEANKGEVDRGIGYVGYQAHDPSGEEHPELVLDNLVEVVRATGAIGVVGVYVAQNPGAAETLAQKGRIPWEYGQFFQKGLRMGTGHAR